MNAAHTSGSFDWRRRNMVQRLAKMGIGRADVLAAMGNVPRHVFVEEALRSRAYDDMSLPLGLGQTISQPYTVAVMTQLMLGDAAAETFGPVLEIGTGCGYQTAVLQAVGLKQIYSVERLQALHEKAKHNLRTARLLGGCAATATSACPKSPRSTASSSPPRPPKCRCPCCNSSLWAAAW